MALNAYLDLSTPFQGILYVKCNGDTAKLSLKITSYF